MLPLESFPSLNDEASLQFNARGELQHLLTLKGLDRTTLTLLLDDAERFVSPVGGEVVRSDSLTGRTIANLFFEPSTRDRKSVV